MRNPLLLFFGLTALGQCFLAQSQAPWTLMPGLLLLLAGAVGFAATHPLRPTQDEKVEEEILWFLVIFGLAVFFRLFRLDGIPPGQWVDSSSDGLGGLKVLHEGWRPFFEDDYSTHSGYLYYLSALWFKFMPATTSSLRLFYVVLALAPFPLIYWTFRQWAGPSTALTGLFLLSVMRVDVSYSHLGYPVNHVAFFIFGTLAFWLHGVRTGKNWAFILAGLFFSLGFYTYHGYKVFGLMAPLGLLIEAIRDREFLRRNAKGLAQGAAAALVVLSPLLIHWISQGSVGRYEMGLFIGPRIAQAKSLAPLFHNLGDFLLQFNRRGDPVSYANFQAHRMFDDTTAVLWVLGVGLALRSFRERWALYALLACAALSLNGLLTLEPTSTRRVLSLVPFLAYLSALAVTALLQAAPKVRILVLAAGALMIGGQNFGQYFIKLAKDPIFRNDSDIAVTRVAEKIAAEGARWDFRLSPRFYGHHTIQFLNYSHPEYYAKLDWPKDLALVRCAPGKEGICFVMDAGQGGWTDLLKTLYPNARVETLRDGEGPVLATFLTVIAEELRNGRGLQERARDGRELVHPHFPSDLSRQTGTRHFHGCFFAEAGGLYQFHIDPGSTALWTLDGKGPSPEWQGTLERGFHSIDLDLRVGPKSRPLLYFRRDGGGWGNLDQDLLTWFPLNQGLLAHYPEPTGGTIAQWDPVINFTYKSGFAYLGPPYLCSWKGTLETPEKGRYEFLLLTEEGDQARLALDGKDLLEAPRPRSAEALLAKGIHPLTLDFRMSTSYFSSLTLAWKKPGQDKFEVIPPSAFGKVTSGPARAGNTENP